MHKSLLKNHPPGESLRKQIRNGNPKRLGERGNLRISHPSQSGFDLRQGGAAKVETDEIALRRENFLRPSPAVAETSNLRSDNVF